MTPQATRRDRLRERMAAHDCTALLITDLSDVRYFCGFSGSNAAMVVTVDEALLATDGRYVTQAGNEAPDVELVVTRNLVVELLMAVRDRGISHVGFDAAALTVAVVAPRTCRTARSKEYSQKAALVGTVSTMFWPTTFETMT